VFGRSIRLKRSVWFAGHLHGLCKSQPAVWFVTLTYRGIEDWRPSHLREAIERYRLFCRAARLQCRYVWVAELQKRGAMHYHLLAWLPNGQDMPFWDQDHGRRKAFWPHGWSNTQEAYAGVGYLMKYLSKLGGHHRFPKGARLYGIGGLDHESNQVRHWANLPEWVKAMHGVGEVRRSKVGCVVQDTGEVLQSPYAVEYLRGSLHVRVVGEVVPRLHDGAYSRLQRA